MIKLSLFDVAGAGSPKERVAFHWLAVLLLACAAVSCCTTRVPETEAARQAARGEFKEAMARAMKGDAEGQVLVASMYEFGFGVKQDSAEALMWWRLAAAQGHPVAQYQFGVMYQFGDRLKRDWVEALRWYRLGAEQDHVPSQGAVGHLYRDGKGVAKDWVEAYAWFNLSAQTHQLSEKWRDEIAAKMSAQQVSSAQGRTQELRALIDAKVKGRGR